MSEKSEGKASLISLKCPSFPSLPISRLDCLKNSLCIGLNIASVVGIVMANKYVFSTFNFPFGKYIYDYW